MNHPKISELTRAIAAEHNLSSRFVDFVLSDSKPQCFDFRCEPAANGWTCFVPDDFDLAYPLWSANADQTLMLINSAGSTFAKGYHDEPDVNILSGTSDGLLCCLFIAMIESEETQTELQAGAEFAGFRFLADCTEFCDKHSANFREYDQLHASFIADIDNRSQ